MTISQLITICHRCDRVDWSVKGCPPCRENGKYFVDNCESGECPLNKFTPEMLDAASKPPEPAAETQGVGSELHRILSSIGIHESVDCSCMAKMREYDAAGIPWAETHQEEISAYLVEQGKKRGWALGVAAKLTAPVIVSKAIERAKENLILRSSS